MSLSYLIITTVIVVIVAILTIIGFSGLIYTIKNWDYIIIRRVLRGRRK